MRTGLFGGTFDPIHLAHLAAAEGVLDRLSLDRMLFIPSATPPHRPTPLTSAGHRMAMVRLAVAGNPRFEPCELELLRGGASYSVDTLEELRRLHPEDEFHFVIGSDAFREVAAWRNPDRLFALTRFAVLSRPGAPFDPSSLRLPAGARVEPVDVPALAVSASDIRARIAAGRSIRYLVPDPVIDYIARNGLYRPALPEREAGRHHIGLEETCNHAKRTSST